MLLLLAWFWIQIKAWFTRKFLNRHGGRGHLRSVLPVICRAQAKPAWVTQEIVRLKALMPGGSCHTLADIFNRRYAASRRMTVGRTFVADTVRKHRY